MLSRSRRSAICRVVDSSEPEAGEILTSSTVLPQIITGANQAGFQMIYQGQLDFIYHYIRIETNIQPTWIDPCLGYPRALFRPASIPAKLNAVPDKLKIAVATSTGELMGEAS